MGESDCAVKEAVNSGTLDAERYDSYVKLIKEQRLFQVNVEDKKRLNKQAGKISREAEQQKEIQVLDVSNDGSVKSAIIYFK